MAVENKVVVVNTLWMPSVNLQKPTDNSSSRRVLVFYWVTQTCSKEDLSLHFIACDTVKLAVLEDGMGSKTDRIKLDYLILNFGHISQKLISKSTS